MVGAERLASQAEGTQVSNTVTITVERGVQEKALKYGLRKHLEWFYGYAIELQECQETMAEHDVLTAWGVSELVGLQVAFGSGVDLDTRTLEDVLEAVPAPLHPVAAHFLDAPGTDMKLDDELSEHVACWLQDHVAEIQRHCENTKRLVHHVGEAFEACPPPVSDTPSVH